MPDPDRLVAAARAILPPRVALAAADPRAPAPPLLPGETAGRAVDKRLREFAAGRQAARSAMAALGLPAVPLPMGADRAPHWPAGVLGSITHTDTACLAAVALSDAVQGVGIDLEPDGRLDPDLWDTILLPAEVMALPRDGAGQAALLVFAAKEAAYKAQYALTRSLIDFHALQVTLGPSTFTAQWQITRGPFRQGAMMEGRHCRTEGHILTALAL